MASVSKLAIVEDAAREALKTSAFVLADALGLDTPVFELHKRHDKEYRRIHELRLISEFMVLVKRAMLAQEDTDEANEATQTLEKIYTLLEGNWTKKDLEAVVLGGKHAITL